MAAYRAPVSEMRFVINELADFESVRALAGDDDLSGELVDAILDEADKFASGVLAPLNVVGDREGCVLENGVVRTPTGFREAYGQFVDGGWNGIHFAAEHGGQGLPRLVSTAVSEMWTSANMAFGLCPLLTQAAADALARHGSAALKAIYLEKLVSGRWTGTMNLTEPQAGSDLAQVRTRALPDGDGGYRITGQKIFITFGDHDLTENVIHMVLARLPDAPDGVHGLSLFLIPKILVRKDGGLGQRNDLRVVSLEHKLGINGSPTALMSYGDNEGALGFLVGEENRGLELMFTMMNSARLAVGLEGIGIAERAYQDARAYALERVQGRDIGNEDPQPVPIAHHPDVQRMLMSMKSQTEAGRALAYAVAADVDIAERHPDPEVRRARQRMVDLLTPVVKAWSTDVGIEVASTAIQVYGGMGYIEESGVAQHLRDARIAAIYEGTNGIQAADLAGRKVARDGGAAAEELISELRALEAGLSSGGEDLGAIRRWLKAGLDDLAGATAWLVSTYPEHPRRVAAVAAHYLRLMGIVAGGGLMAKAALKAAGHLAHGEGDPGFWQAKLVSARFFAEVYLSRSGALRLLVTDGWGALEAFDPDRDL
ncbi:MAG: acyl-CoA dehydrogenase [Rhodospirillales bacterium]|jgi:alkylation response protein AidB-like acyl-CoA dehydrogenase|nr:acyl-CoA dehydrogenase [Rhodospirillales bacterium]